MNIIIRFCTKFDSTCVSSPLECLMNANTTFFKIEVHNMAAVFDGLQ
jgi:hypothetical protein